MHTCVLRHIQDTKRERKINVKKILIIILVLTLVSGLAACNTGNRGDGGKNDSLNGSLEDILKKIYDTAQVSDSFRQFVEEGLQTLPVTSDRTGYYLGKDDIKFAEAIASEPIMSTSAYSLVLVRAGEGADVEKLKTDIKENVDPQKWICVGVEKENIIVDNIGDVVILIMSDFEAKALHDAFLGLKDR